MAVTITSSSLPPQTGGIASSSSLTVVANTKKLIFFIALDNSNTTTNNIAPSVVSWNGVNATLVGNTPSDASSPFGQPQWVYEINNPTAGTGTATVNHATQYHHITIAAIVSPTPVTVTYSDFNTRGTGTSFSRSMPSSAGDTVLYSVLADALNGTDVVANNGSVELVVTGGSSRQLLRLSKTTSSGLISSENWTLTTSQRYSAVAVNIADGVYQVDSVNGSSSNPAINVDSVNTANTTGIGTITSLNISDGTRSISPSVNMPSGDGTFSFTWPYSDGTIAPLFDVPVTATFGDGVRTVSIVGTYPIPSNYSSVTFIGATNLSPYHLGSVLTLLDEQRFYWPNGIIISSDGSLDMNGLSSPYVLNGLLHNTHTGGDGSIVAVTLTINVTGGGSVDTKPSTTRLITTPVSMLITKSVT